MSILSDWEIKHLVEKENMIEPFVSKEIKEIDGKKTKVKENDTILIKANQSQRITNIGKCDLEFYCICTPRFYLECYINLEI